MFSLELLEYQKVLEQLTAFAQTFKAKSVLNKLHPSTNQLEIETFLDETEAALHTLIEYSRPPFGGLTDTTGILGKIKIQSVLSPYEFLEVVSLIRSSNLMKQYQRSLMAEEIEHAPLNHYFEALTASTDLKERIESVISDEGYVLDSASTELRRIRNKIHIIEDRIQTKASQILSSQSDYLTDQILTIRHNKMVVPVKITYKNSFKGSVIDYSQSGETVYIEPLAIQELNNELMLIKEKEAEEIETILRNLTIECSFHYEDLLNTFESLISLDVVYSKAAYAKKFHMTRPIITDDTLYLKQARHPLIDSNIVVPNTIKLSQEQKIMVITGPNTGGKTVTLKTIGLLSLMTQSGLLIPVSESSSIMIFNKILSDIGDEQSIEQSLSTFSSHMTRIVSITENADKQTLVLLDELGSGTDPKEGSSLAISILNFLRAKQAHVIATTHYPEIKTYAYTTEGVINASVEFDIDTLSPTYKLLIGVPGTSNAFKISARLGLDKAIIKKAEETLDTTTSNVALLIQQLEKQSIELSDSQEELDNLRREVEEQKEALKIQRLELKNKIMHFEDKEALLKSHIIKDTKQKAQRIMNELKALIDKEHIKPHELARLKGELNDLDKKEIKTADINQTISVGDTVRILSLNRLGEVTSIKKNKIEVQLGILKSTYKVSEVEFIRKAIKKDTTHTTYVGGVNTINVLPECDLRGLRYEEAYQKLETYVDKCLLSHLESARIIHGYGTLVIRNMVLDYIKKSKQIKSSRPGEQGEGGRGVTVIKFI
jgi:DNA mismatch repair protein MutS2